jgi:hypothetical protein
MRDVLFVLIVIGFFALTGLYVRGCAAVVGPGPEPEIGGADEDGEAAA